MSIDTSVKPCLTCGLVEHHDRCPMKNPARTTTGELASYMPLEQRVAERKERNDDPEPTGLLAQSMRHTEDMVGALVDAGKRHYEAELKPSFRSGLYKHYKGGMYLALHLVEHHETGVRYVVYVSLTHGIMKIREWDTPGCDSWCDKVRYNEGEAVMNVPRFEFLGPKQPWIPHT